MYSVLSIKIHVLVKILVHLVYGLSIYLVNVLLSLGIIYEASTKRRTGLFISIKKKILVENIKNTYEYSSVFFISTF